MRPTEPELFLRIPAWLAKRSDVSAAEKLVYAALADRIGNNAFCWPGQRRIGADCGLGRNTVNRVLRRLAAAGLIAVEAPEALTGSRQDRTCRYEIRPQNGDVPKMATSPKWCRQRHQNGAGNVTKMVHKPYQGNQTKGTIRRRASQAKPDAWELATTAMTSDVLRTDAFRAAWMAWTTYRREARKPLTPSTITRQIHDLETYGHDNAVISIERSIGNGWQGLFPPDGGRAAPARSGKRAGSAASAGTDRRSREYPEDDPLPILNRPAASGLR